MTLASTQIANIIATVGFPIAAFLLMWRFTTVTVKENTTAFKALADSNNIIIEAFIKKVPQ